MRVDDFYLGVLVPAGTAELELEFRPWVRCAWIPQVFFAAAALAVALARLRRASSQRRSSSSGSPLPA